MAAAIGSKYQTKRKISIHPLEYKETLFFFRFLFFFFAGMEDIVVEASQKVLAVLLTSADVLLGRIGMLASSSFACNTPTDAAVAFSAPTSR